MKATIYSKDTKAIDYEYQTKELVGYWEVVVNTKTGLTNPITVRLYMDRSSTASTVYASIWVSSMLKLSELYNSGSGKAKGTGYHKESEAIARAIESAGIKLDKDIGGAGNGAVKEALLAIAKAVGYRGKVLIVTS